MGTSIEDIIPDGSARLVNISARSDQNIEDIYPVFLGGQDYDFNFHKSIFDLRFLKKLLIEAGFIDVDTWKSSDLFASSADFSSHPMSLNVSASTK